MSQLNNKQLRYPLSGSFTGSLLGSATSASYVNLLQGSNVTINYTPSGILISSAGTGSGTSAAGTTGQIQYNYNGAFAGVPVLTYDGSTLRATGSFQGLITSASQAISSSHSLTASYALNAGTTINTGSFVTTSSFNAFTSSYNTGSFKGSLQGTASWANNVVSSSYALTASYALNGGGSIDTTSFVTTSSFNTYTSSANSNINSLNNWTGSNSSRFLGTASLALTASLAPNYVLNSATSSFVQNSQTSSFVTNSQTGSFVTNTQTSSFVQNSQTGSFVTTSSFNSYIDTNTSQFAGTSSFATTASYALNAAAAVNTSSLLITASITPANSNTIRFTKGDGTNFDITVNTGSVGLSFPYTGSAIVSGSLIVTGSTISTLGFTGSLSGTSSWASNSLTASYVTGSIFTSTNPVLSSSYALSSSFASIALSAPNYVLNSDTGSFIKSDQTSSFLTTGSFNSYTSSVVSTSSFNTYTGSVITTSSFNAYTSSVVTTSSFNAYTSSVVSTSSFNAYTSSVVSTSSFNTYTSSVVTTSSFNAYTSSVVTTSSFNAYTSSVVSTSSFNTYTSSVVTTSSFNAYTSSVLTTSSFNNWTGSSTSIFYGSSSYVSGSVFTSENPALSASYALTASYAINAGSGVGFPFSGSAVITGSLLVSGSEIAITGSLNVSSSIKAYNINVGTPTSNNWKQNLEGSYFNTFNSDTNTSEILRFVAGLLSASAPSPLPNARIFSDITIQELNAGTVVRGGISGYLPNGITTAISTDLAYLQNQGFIAPGGTAFSGQSINTELYTASWRSSATGNTTVSSSVDAQLFGLGESISTVLPSPFSVSGAIFYKFEDYSTGGAINQQSSSQYLATQNSFGTSNGLTVGLINTSNPTVIPPRFQDGKFFSPFGFTASLYNGGTRPFNSVSASGYYQITASVMIKSGSSLYSPAIENKKRILYAPGSTIESNISNNSITFANRTVTSGSATSSSLSGAQYLTSMQYMYSVTASGVFNPMYAALASLCQTNWEWTADPTVGSITLTYNSGVTALDTATGVAGTIRTDNTVYSSAGSLRSIGSIPSYDDVVRLRSTYTLGGTGYTMTENTPGATSFPITTFTKNRKGNAGTSDTGNVTMFPAGDFQQPAASGSMQFFGGGNAAPTTVNENFVTESYRKQIGASTTPGLLTWNKNKRLTLGNGGELQVKPGYLVDPEDSQKGYWYPTSAYSADNYKWYLREFDTAATVNRSNLLITLSGTTTSNWVDFNSTTAGGIAVGVLFDYQIANRGANKVVIFDAIKGNASYGGTLDNQSANTYVNPFSDAVDVKGDFSSKSINGAQITLGLTNSIGQKIDGTNFKIWILVRYRGSATNSLTGITISTS